MFKAFIPTFHATSLYEVPVDFYAKHGIKNILIDLDNTLGSYKDLHPRPQAVSQIEQLVKHGYNLLIISNNKGPRVRTYADNLGVPCLSSTRKPFKAKLRNFMKSHGFVPHETILVGDQLLTDSLVAHNLGIKMLLVEKLVKEDQWTTRFNRLFDKPLRAHFKKKKKLTHWSHAYD
ncbi:MAG TPA: YqeG family HAD IIIA-type phosphatase [Firmicutes bacterium]|nr:YqeG family HAD IIIA-type phosphatase [Bacillota bacterium]